MPHAVEPRPLPEPTDALLKDPDPRGWLASAWPRRAGRVAPSGVPPWLVLATALAVTALIVATMIASGRARDRERFEHVAEAARGRVAARLEIYIALLRSASGLLAIDPDLTRADFATYVRRLGIREHYPGVQGIGFTRRIPPGRVAAVEARMRREGIAEFRVHPDTPRAEHHAIIYLEPLDRRNAAAIGYDMFTEPVRREAMARARDTGQPAMSGRVRLVQEIDGPVQAGFLIYVPVYEVGANPTTVAARRAAHEGFAHAPFRADDLLAGIFGTGERQEVDLRIYDGDAPAPDHLLHVSRRGGPPSRLPYVDTLPMTIAGRRWTIIATPSSQFGRSIRFSFALAALAGGIVTGIALYQFARARRRALIRIGQARDLLTQVLEQAPVAMCVLRGRNHVYELANPRYRVLVREDPIGKPVREVVAEEEARGLLAVLDKVYATGIPWIGHGVEYWPNRAGKPATEPSFFNVLYHPFTDDAGATIGIIAVGVDVTEETRSRREAEIARQQAESANRAKSDFLAAMSHELRTPLNAITGYVQLMQLGIPGPVTAQQQDALDRIRRSAGHLLTLINDVLNFAKLEAGRIEFDVRDVPLRAVVDGVVHMIEPQLAARGLAWRIEIPDDIVVRADPEKLRQILLNLLSNAAKFTEEGSVTIDAATPPDDGTRVCLRVADTGVGIPRDRLAEVFDPFVQVNRTLSSRIEGTGLGLAISRDLARGMGADLTVRSEVGRGSTFSVVLRRA